MKGDCEYCLEEEPPKADVDDELRGRPPELTFNRFTVQPEAEEMSGLKREENERRDIYFVRGFERRQCRIWVRVIQVTSRPVRKFATKNPDSDGWLCHSRPRVKFPSSNRSVRTRRVLAPLSPLSIRTWSSLTACAAHRPLTTTPSFDNGRTVPATPGCHSLLVERSYRGHESCEGGFKHDTSQGSFWFRQRHSRHDQSEFPARQL